MIFVTVGTHEQPFNRLIEYIDNWSEGKKEEVVLQTGFSTYIPCNCVYQNLYKYSEMIKMVKEARIVITHGGPSSFIMPLQEGKIPIVVPRQKDFNEHVNNHQLDFCKEVSERLGNIILIENIDDLGNTIENYDEIILRMTGKVINNNTIFCEKFEQIVNELVK